MMRTLLLAAIFLSACGPLASADPCVGRSNSAECRLYSAQVEATLDASEAQRIAQAERVANERIVAATQQAAEIEHAQALAYAGATATVEAAQAQAAIDRANAEATIVAATIEAQRSAAEATSTAVANQIMLDREYLAATATAQALRDESALRHQQKENEINLARFGGFVEGALKLVLGLAVIGAVAYAFIRVVNAAWQWFDEWRRVHAKRVDVGDGRIVIYDYANGRVIDPRLALTPVTDLSADVISGLPPGVADLLLAVKKIVETAEVYRAMARAKVDVDEGDSALIEVGRQSGTPESAELPPGEAGRLPSAPAFAQLSAAWRPTIGRMLLGYGVQGPIYGGIDDLLSVGIAGRPRQGKTTLLRFVCAQCWLVGAEVVVWDLHGTVAGDMAGASAYTTIDDISHSAQAVLSELDHRLQAHRDDRPMLILIDEFPALSLACQEAIHAARRIVLEGSKAGMFALLSAQGMPASSFGGSLVRDALSSRYVFRTTPLEARRAGLDKDSAHMVRLLDPGHAILDGPVEPQIVAIPNTTVDDLRLILPASQAAYATSGSGDGSGNGSGSEVAGEVAPEVDSARRKRVRELLRQRTPVRRIIEQEWGATGGNSYKRAATEFGEIVAKLVA